MELKEQHQQQLNLQQHSFQRQEEDLAQALALVLQSRSSALTGFEQQLQQVKPVQPWQRQQQQQVDRPWWFPLAMLGIPCGCLTVIVSAAILSANSPSAQITAQQEILGAVAMEASKQRSNNVCLFAVHCPDSGSGQNNDDRPTSITSENVSIAANLNPEYVNQWQSIDLETINRDKLNRTFEQCQQFPGWCEARDYVYQQKFSQQRGARI